MDAKQLGIVCVTLIVIIAGYVLLAVSSVDTSGYASFIVAAILPTVLAGRAAQNSKEAKEHAARAEHNTNGTLSKLIARNRELEDRNSALSAELGEIKGEVKDNGN